MDTVTQAKQKFTLCVARHKGTRAYGTREQPYGYRAYYTLAHMFATYVTQDFYIFWPMCSPHNQHTTDTSHFYLGPCASHPTYTTYWGHMLSLISVYPHPTYKTYRQHEVVLARHIMIAGRRQLANKKQNGRLCSSQHSAHDRSFKELWKSWGALSLLGTDLHISEACLACENRKWKGREKKEPIAYWERVVTFDLNSVLCSLKRLHVKAKILLGI